MKPSLKRLGHRKACFECSRRHIKCDGRRPTCTPCGENGWNCTATVARCPFRHDHNPTAHASNEERRRKRRKRLKYNNQSWVPMPQILKFVEDDPTAPSSQDAEDSDGDEENRGAVSPEHGRSEEYSEPPPQQTSSHSHSSHHHSPPEEVHGALDNTTAHLSPDWFPVETPRGGGTISELQASSSHTLDELPEISAVGSLPGEYFDVGEWPAVPSYDHDRSVTAELPVDDVDYLDPISPIDSSGLWPLKRDEAMLLQYFITELSPWFDFCDKDRHFGTTVVQLSSTCEPLLNAILAVSAKHLSLTSEYCPLASDKYQRKCLQILIPALNDQDSLLDPTLFAATAILRLFDEMTDPVGDRHSRGHILGTHILLRAQETPSPTSSLRAASLLVALRQEIFISFFTRTAVQPLADYLPISRSSSSSATPDDSDYAWAVRAIALAADALTFCHGHAGKSVEGWHALRERLEAWQRGKPPSFAPVRYEPRKPFPRIRFANDCHIGAQLYSDVCRILLLAHDPRVPALGLERANAAQYVDERIRGYVRRMCGVAVSHPECHPALSVTGMVIAMCGDRFSGREEQEQLLCILKRSEAHITWPHLRAHEQLSKHWKL